MSRVFVVHQPTGRDRATGAIRDTMDLSPAAAYGELVFVLRDWANPLADFQACADEVERVFRERDFGAGDWVLLVGNPCLIGLVAAEAVLRTGALRLLQWDRSAGTYRPVTAQVIRDDAAPAGAYGDDI